MFFTRVLYPFGYKKERNAGTSLSLYFVFLKISTRKGVSIMRDMLKNELMLLLDKIIDTETLKTVEPQIECILSNYEVEKRKYSNTRTSTD